MRVLSPLTCVVHQVERLQTRVSLVCGVGPVVLGDPGVQVGQVHHL